MSSSPPDISSLCLSSQSNHQRIHDIYDYEQNQNPRPSYHFQTSPPVPAQSQYNPLNLANSPAKKPARAALPTQWLDAHSDSRSLSPNNNSDFSSAGGSPPPISHFNQAASLSSQSIIPSPSPPIGQVPFDDEIIPTAIVIKNIPFNVKRETLLDIIASLAIPTPYAFNYHLDQQGAFRGLAFANFRQSVDADAVVAALNGFDVQGRKLRVEYKKVLQAGEKERIEREKAIRRMRSMQLEKEQHTVVTPVYDEYQQPPMTAPFAPQRSFSSGPSYQQQQQQSFGQQQPGFTMPQYNIPQSVPQPPLSVTPSDKTATELDLNDPSTLEIYSRILLFKDDHMRDELAFSRNLAPKQRRVVHLIAQKLGVFHYSIGEGEDRYAVVTRTDPQRQQQQIQQQQPQATRPPHTLSRAPSAYLNASASQAPPNLRVKKSMPDMKTLHSQAPRLNSRASNGNIREGYATIASPSRRVSVPFSGLFGNSSSTFGGAVPPVPNLPSGIGAGAMSGNGSGPDTPASVVRQPRGPGADGFMRRDSRVGTFEGTVRGGLDARSYEPLEI
ncbi:hypothetical protein BDV98DRAFT_558097 [Pterulicium gracile]|uniref:RRM domain-containing protein n=1 Tax=Pterulicium gracile TaxID=1884261 RepID=A0A5C3R318_9AGAR|nr:hypothetical protein BDV98DRAFT_558097 [Pterula gracilis]